MKSKGLVDTWTWLIITFNSYVSLSSDKKNQKLNYRTSKVSSMPPVSSKIRNEIDEFKSVIRSNLYSYIFHEF